MANQENDLVSSSRLEGPPSGYFVLVPPKVEEDTVDLAKVVAIVVSSWKLLLAAALVCGFIAGVVSLQMPSLYRAQALVAPVSQGGTGASALRGQFGGLAALAGIDLGTNSGTQEEAYATLVSSGFARDFIAAERLPPILFSERWDSVAKQWRVGQKAPTVEQTVKKFMSDVRSITKDHKTGLITVTVDWYSPALASRWVNSMIDMANQRLRADAIRNAEQSIEYLNKELAKSGVVELRHAIYRLIESQVNNAMVANVQREYAFHFIDRAVPSQERISPRRTVMVLVGAALGLFVGLVLVFLRHAFRTAPLRPKSA
jgi:uncharacterized protein involved in exopolysaccharide biosynthesis